MPEIGESMDKAEKAIADRRREVPYLHPCRRGIHHQHHEDPGNHRLDEDHHHSPNPGVCKGRDKPSWKGNSGGGSEAEVRYGSGRLHRSDVHHRGGD